MIRKYPRIGIPNCLYKIKIRFHLALKFKKERNLNGMFCEKIQRATFIPEEREIQHLVVF